MIKELVKKPYMKLDVEWLTPAKNWYKDLLNKIPELEFKTSISTLDEFIIIETTFDGVETKKVYNLKAGIDNNKFNYKHTIKENDDLDFVKSNALKQYDIWKSELETNKNKTIENGN